MFDMTTSDPFAASRLDSFEVRPVDSPDRESLQFRSNSTRFFQAKAWLLQAMFWMNGVCAVFAWPGPCFAQRGQAPLAIEVDVDSSLNRSGGPIPLILHFNYFGTQPGVTGNLECRLVSTDGTLMGTYLFEGLYLTRGEQIQSFLLQPPTSGVWQDAYDFYVTFTTSEGKRYAFPEQLLRLPGAGRRSCVITVATSDESFLDKHEKELAAELDFENRMPSPDESRPTERSIITLSRPLNIQDFPTQPLEHCVSDLVLLVGKSFEKLSDRQEKALLAWVRAGGSLAILLDDSEKLPSRKIDVLNQLLNSSDQSPVVSQLSSGRLQFALQGESSVLLRNCGQGRVVLAPDPKQGSLADAFGEKVAREVYIHLWKVRREQALEIRNSLAGNWSFDPGKRYTVMNNSNFDRMDDPGIQNFVRRFRPTPTTGGTGLLQQTFPQGMQMLPLWLIGVTLLFYVLAIGPLDYLLLGAFRIRKYTWIFFPVVTIIFTAGAIVSANYKMRGHDSGGRVLILDVSKEGLVVRENEIRTYLPSTGGELLIDANRELLTLIHPQQLGVNNPYAGNSRSPESFSIPPVYRGRFPIEAQILQRVHKWSPEMVRRLRIPAVATQEPSGFDWSQQIDPTNQGTRSELTKRIQDSFGEHCFAQLLHRDARDDSRRSAQHGWKETLDLIHLCGPNDFFDSLYEHQQLSPVNMARPAVGNQDRYFAPDNFLRNSALREEAGMYSVVSQLSPKCDDFLEDLPILDPTDENSWLLMIGTQVANHWKIYRQIVKVGH